MYDYQIPSSLKDAEMNINGMHRISHMFQGRAMGCASSRFGALSDAPRRRRCPNAPPPSARSPAAEPHTQRLGEAPTNRHRVEARRGVIGDAGIAPGGWRRRTMAAAAAAAASGSVSPWLCNRDPIFYINTPSLDRD